MTHTIIFDIESIPDIDFIRQILDEKDVDEPTLIEKASEELANNKKGFLPPIYQRIVAWVCICVTNDGEPKQKYEWYGEDEKKGIKTFSNILEQYPNYKLVHFNGRGFDIPLLMYRAMKHYIPLSKRLFSKTLRYRYGIENLDIMDYMSGYGGSSYPKLAHVASLIQIPLKQSGSGDMVHKLFQEKKWEHIKDYCYEDVLGTYLIWLQMQYINHQIPKEKFEDLRKRGLDKLYEIQQKY